MGSFFLDNLKLDCYYIDMKYIYECNGETKNLKDDQETLVEHKSYFVVVCNDCCNIPVLHLLERGETNE